MGRRPNKPNYPPEFKARAIELCLRAIIAGWSVARFARHSHVPRVTMLEWLADDTVFDRYARAMQVKALDIPAMHADVVRMLIEGTPKRDAEGIPIRDSDGQVVREYMDPKRAGVALRSLEFRMMRELKRIYEPTRTVNHQLGVATMPDSEIVSRYQALKKKALDEARAEAMTIEGTAREV
jgi:transposase-like protein